MNETLDNITFENICKTIGIFFDCMDDFLYVYDLINDRYYISPSAMKRFALTECLFTDVGETHRQFVFEKDYEMLMEDLQKIIDGEIDTHNLVYRWLDHEMNPVWINCRGKKYSQQKWQTIIPGWLHQ